MTRLLPIALLTACSGHSHDGSAPGDGPGTSPPTDTAASTSPDTGGCEDQDRDCAGVCFGTSEEDPCGVCDADAANDCGTSVSVTGDWACTAGKTCQDVYQVDLAKGSQVDLTVDQLTGGSVVRLAVFRPGQSLGDDDVLVGVPKDLTCWGQDETATTSFVADEAGTWSFAVGRDSAASAQPTGSYALHVVSSTVVSLSAPSQDDGKSEAAGERCGSEYVVDADWSCPTGVTCQDVYTTVLPAGYPLQLSVLAVTGTSTPRLALYPPGVALGDVNLLTNTTDDRNCGGQDADDVEPPFTTADGGLYTLAVGRDASASLGLVGTYRLSISMDGGFFTRPIAVADNVAALSAAYGCYWRKITKGSWNCASGVSCQDVYNLPLTVGSSVAGFVFNVKGSSVVRLAAFEPGEPLSGTNLHTGLPEDLMCGGQDALVFIPTVDATVEGTYRFAVGRDWNTSGGASGDYHVEYYVYGGYSTVVRTVQDTASEALDGICPNY